MKLVIEGVGKLYNGKVWGLRDFSLELGPGMLGLLGPNGAGKLDFGKLPFLYRLIAEAMGSPEGDFRDWASQVHDKLTQGGMQNEPHS